MPGRTRRVRLLALGSLVFFVFLIYTRDRSRHTEKYLDYFGDKIEVNRVGGGAVLRPSLNDIPPQQERYPTPHNPDDDPNVTWEEVWVDAPGSDAAQPNIAADQQKNGFQQQTDGRMGGQEQLQQAHQEETRNGVNSGNLPAQNQVPVPNDANPQAIPPVMGLPPTTTTTPPVAVLTPPTFPDQNLLDGQGQGRVEIPDPLAGLETSTRPHWTKQPEFFPVKTPIPLPTAESKPFAKIQRAEEKLAKNGADETRLAIIKQAAHRTWDGYRTYAFGSDEIKPVSGETSNPFNGWGATLVDALDTLWIMGFKDQFEEAVAKTAEIDFTTSKRSDIPLFETTIRYLGGLIAAFDVTGRDPKYKNLLDKAVELAEIMYSAFDSPNRMPQTYYRWNPSHSSQPHRAGSRVVLAELGSLSLEFTRLAQLTGESKYYDAIARITEELDQFQNLTRLPGLWPTTIDASGCEIDRTIHSSGNRPMGRTIPQDELKGMIAGEPVELGSDTSQHGGRKGSLEAGKQLTARSHVEVDRMFDTQDQCIPKGLTSSSPHGTETFTLSGMADSTYEYLSKEYILLGGQVDEYKQMYLASADAAIQHLLYKPMTIDERDILMPGELKVRWDGLTNEENPWPYTKVFNPEIAHLACFAGGMFAMGGVIFDKPEHLEIGAKLANGCVWAYESTATGIMPEGGAAMQCAETWGPCPWNQTAYYDIIDPYWESRANSARAKKSTPAIPQTEAGPPVGVPAAPVPISDPPMNPIRLGGNTPDALPPAGAAPGLIPAAPGLAPPVAAPPQPPVPGAQGDTGAHVPKAGLFKRETSEPLAAENNDLNKRQLDFDPETNWDLDGDGVLSQAEYVAKRMHEDGLPYGFIRITGRRYLLRPEAIESVFYMYRITGDMHWREVGWRMFEAVEQHARTDYGYSAINDITSHNTTLENSQESFWMAETLKYFYLLFDDPKKWSLDEWVLNTEAHFFKRPAFKFAS